MSTQNVVNDHRSVGTTNGPGSAAAAWSAALDPLGMHVDANGAPAGPTASGIVRYHNVKVLTVGSPRHNIGLRTQYIVSLNAPHAPQFSLGKRKMASQRIVSTGNPAFDAVVAVATGDAVKLSSFLTPQRRNGIEHLVANWASVQVTGEQIRLFTEGLDTDVDRVRDTVRTMVGVAVELSKPVFGEVSLNEGYVLSTLFDSNLSVDEIAEEFELFFADRTVAWSGEVLQVGSVDRAGQRIAMLIGSADGSESESGRVVALAVVDPAMDVDRGDVVQVQGQLLNLDAKKRLFRIE